MNRIHLSILVSVSITLIAPRCYGENKLSWKGLCPPQSLVTWVQPGDGEQSNDAMPQTVGHLKSELDKDDVPLLGLYISAAELAQKMPGYISKINETIDGREIPQHLGMTVTIKLAEDAIKPHQEGSQTIYEAIWSLSRVWAGFTWEGAKVEKMKGTAYFKVIPQTNIRYDDYFALLRIDPRVHGNSIPFNDFNSWYIGTCGARNSAMGFECNRSLLGKDYFVQYTVDKPNINLVPQLDNFISEDMQSWKEACAHSAKGRNH